MPLRGASGSGRSASTLAIAVERLSRDGDGLVVYELKHAFRDGTTQFCCPSMHVIARLAALVPRRRCHLVRYHGVLAPNARHRHLVVPTPPPEPAHDEAEATGSPTRAAMTWAQRWLRVFAIDISRCPWLAARTKAVSMLCSDTQ